MSSSKILPNRLSIVARQFAYRFDAQSLLFQFLDLSHVFPSKRACGDGDGGYAGYDRKIQQYDGGASACLRSSGKKGKQP